MTTLNNQSLTTIYADDHCWLYSMYNEVMFQVNGQFSYQGKKACPTSSLKGVLRAWKKFRDAETTVYSCTAYSGDGKGDYRTEIYQRFGFVGFKGKMYSFPSTYTKLDRWKYLASLCIQNVDMLDIQCSLQTAAAVCLGAAVGIGVSIALFAPHLLNTPTPTQAPVPEVGCTEYWEDCEY